MSCLLRSPPAPRLVVWELNRRESARELERWGRLGDASGKERGEGGEGQSRWGPVVRGGRETRVGAMDGGDAACGALPVLIVCVCLYVWE